MTARSNVRLTPSEVLAALAALHPWLEGYVREGWTTLDSIPSGSVTTLGPIVALFESVPVELWPPNNDDRALLLVEMARMRATLDDWIANGGRSGPLRAQYVFSAISMLKRCPDEAAGADAPLLAFISGESFRLILRTDMESARLALEAGSFKAAAVLYGSVIESILVDEILSADPLDRQTRCDAIRAQTPQDRRLFKDMEPLRWTLEEAMRYSLDAGIIGKNAGTLVDLAREYRNLIHPGRVVRTEARVTLATALTARAAMHAVIDDREAATATRRN